ncbi:hypothetical protein H0H10_13140 [Streptomyces sp. TRM S81-3]|uniref:Uncharacterized protein n=1 Tax=Streptomyces griseicoloratus TaxID=2752516 RepID=A0A926QQQ9_9ACTN|nr:hypothetical protein [Streptomyces griseicoloratus]MBD0420101.1 hypothetical protein [Streptomyces griseicoloratus]
MDLRGRIVRAALGRPRVLAAVSAGATERRLAVEAELARRGWPCAAAPAEADLLVVAADPGPGTAGAGTADWVARLWEAMPAPRARVPLADAGEAAAVLDHGLAELRRRGGARHGGGHRGGHAPAPPAGSPDSPQDPDGPHAGHDSGLVDGLPLAGRADDRDGLRLDRLHLPLGPALPDWPAGLVLRVALQGDVVQRAAVEADPPGPGRLPFWNEPWLRAAAGERVARGEAARRLCAAHLDSLGRFFAVTGWPDLAARARYARDRALGGAGAAELSALVRPLTRRARGSRTLRWLTAGVGVLPAGRARSLGVAGDAHGRMLGWLDAVARAASACDDGAPLAADPAVGPRGPVHGPVPASRALLDALPGLLEGAEFACARIVVASLDPDLDELARAPLPGAAHG